ncbi:YdcF family protein [Candidatus Accumulibacter sp. ACC003]|uniref:YdcF family protein n=1 Tax=Candidatus Accumulibacter sp. ACC003 TaxID=2823334 RepID=UPI0025C20FA1|nr:YdcF family protein [Candidatus Accumulibacter sp. ACC003]
MASRLRLFWWSLAAFLVCFFSLGTILSLRAGSAQPTELVVVLGGGGPERFATGLQLIQSGSANKLLLINRLTSEINTAKDAVGLDEFTLSTDVLSRNSWEEAIRTRAWMSEHGVTRVAVVSDPPHMLRLAYTWSRVFAGTSLSYSLVATQPAWWSAWRWWANRESRRFVGSEVLKLAYYVWHY